MNHSNGALAGLTPDELRDAVRAVIREVLPDGLAPGPGTPSSDVVIATDADLTAFVRRVAALCDDPEQRAALQEGRHGFRLSSAVEVRAERASKPPGLRIERGAVTERAVVKAAAAGGRLVLGRGAVLTPLAKDKARSLGVEIEKEG